MRSSRDTYGIKTLRPGQRKYIAGKTRDQFRRCLARYVERHAWLRAKVFEWAVIGDVLEVRRVM